MKKSIVKFLCTFLVLVLMLSTTTMAVFAAETAHSHTYVVTDGGNGFLYKDNSYHYYGHFENHACTCGYSYQDFDPYYTSLHVATPGSGQLVGSTVGDDGRMLSTYQYICKTCYSAYMVNVLE